jgi:3-phenylpropionate/trans-cinnamate dioxygenase ferredoxin reductase subunit
VGLHGPGDRLVVQGSLDDERFQALWVAGDGTVTAGMHANDWDAIERIREAVDSGGPARAAAYLSSM